jgi:hypothetical protein
VIEAVGYDQNRMVRRGNSLIARNVIHWDGDTIFVLKDRLRTAYGILRTGGCQEKKFLYDKCFVFHHYKEKVMF